MRITFKHLIVTFAVLLVGAVLAGRAAAMSPVQTNSWYLAQAIQFNQQNGSTPYGSIEHFWSTTLSAWGKPYVRPGAIWYGDYFGNRDTACANNGVAINTASWRNNAFYCPADSTVYLDYEYLNSQIARYGDYGAGGIIAHEWGHRIQHVLGYTDQSFRREYHADCLAGMYTRWAYGRLLSGGDYGEFSNWLSDRAVSPSHGSGAWRVAWFKFGYTEYNLASCDAAWRMSTALTFAHGKASRSPFAPPKTNKRFNLRTRTPGLPTGSATVAAGRPVPSGVAGAE